MFGFGKKKTSPENASHKMGRESGEQIIKILVDQVNEKMPAILQLYLDGLSRNFDEAAGDTDKILVIWDDFKVAVADIPNVLEQAFRSEYSDLFVFLKDQGLDHLIAGIIKQEVAKQTDRLPRDIEAAFLASERDGAGFDR